jgi:hypothetical protein
VEAQLGAVDIEMARAERRQPVASVLLGVFPVADADQRAVEQTDHRREHLLPGHPAFAHVLGDAFADLRQRAGELQDPLVLVAVAHLAPIGMVAILLTPSVVTPGRLNMAVGLRADPYLGPGRRHGQRTDAL